MGRGTRKNQGRPAPYWINNRKYALYSLHPYCTAPKGREIEQREINKMLDFQVIEPDEMKWASPIVFAPKKGWDTPLLRQLPHTQRHNRIPRSSNPTNGRLLRHAGQCNYHFDTWNEKWNRKVEIAPGTISRSMYVILSTVEWQFALVNLDYIAVFSLTPDEHINRVQEVLTLLHDASVMLQLKKRDFSQMASII